MRFAITANICANAINRREKIGLITLSKNYDAMVFSPFNHGILRFVELILKRKKTQIIYKTGKGFSMNKLIPNKMQYILGNFIVNSIDSRTQIGELHSRMSPHQGIIRSNFFFTKLRQRHT